VPPFRALPCSSDLLRRSPTSSSSSPPNELSHGGRNHRHHRGYLAGNELLCHRNSSSPAILRPNQAHRQTQGEPPIRPHPFPLFLSRRSTRHGRRRRGAWEQVGLGRAQPTRLGWPAHVAAGPFGQSPRVKQTPV
jgi:hypothetical protein